MTEPSVPGIKITTEADRVRIAVEGEAWEGSAQEAERLLSGMHYALGRARPGVNIASVFVDGTLWGGKFAEADREQAINHMKQLLLRLGEILEDLEAQ